MYKKHFQEQAYDWKHLREQFNRLRRVVDHYLVHDLPTVVSALKSAHKKNPDVLGNQNAIPDEV